jgi:hypothetical protein
MMDILFFVKTFVLTVAIVLLLQTPVGDKSLETHAMTWIQSSAVVAPLHSVARGAAKVVHELSHQVSGYIHDNVNKNKKEDSKVKKESSFHWSHGSKDPKARED